MRVFVASWGRWCGRGGLAAGGEMANSAAMGLEWEIFIVGNGWRGLGRCDAELVVMKAGGAPAFFCLAGCRKMLAGCWARLIEWLSA